MSLFPLYSVPKSGVGSQLPLYTDVAMDYQSGTPRWESGNPVLVSGLEAVKSWAWRAVATARYRYPAFAWDYGCRLESLVGRPYRAGTKRSEAARYIREALLASPYITDCTVEEIRFEGAVLRAAVSFTCVYGKEKFHV